MITIKIGTAEHRDGDIDARWITDQVNKRRKEGEKFCVFFKVNCGDVNLNLTSRDCPKSGSGDGGGGRSPNVKEEFILDEWRKKGFPMNDVDPGMVVSFWEFLKRLCD
ncbi:MAG: hypothetical protein LAT80_13755 [Balneolaceae bacterium]|nr:hypothetical protein [Balneolaceae bacterium]